MGVGDPAMWLAHRSRLWYNAMMIRDDMDVTVEAGAFENDAHKGERARVVKIVQGFFACILLESGEQLGCFTEYLQPRMTAHNAELTAQSEGALA